MKISPRSLQIILTLILISVFSMFCFSVLGNIQYPLLWNDEGDTALYAKRVLQFGYPKVHDGKNIPLQASPSDVDLITDKKTDALLESDWIQYYFSAPFVFVASKTNNLYFQTAIVRIPHAIIGIVGIIIFALSIYPVFRDKKSKFYCLIIFISIELLSLPLALHLREIRYYSLLIFTYACLINVFLRYHVFNNLSYKKYLILIIILSLILLNTFHPAFFPFMFFLIINIITSQIFTEKKYINRLLIAKKSIFPILIILLLSIPYFLFFKTFNIAFAMSSTYKFTINYYFVQLSKIINLFWNYDFLFSVITFKLIIYYFLLGVIDIDRYQSIKNKIIISNYLTLIFVIYFLFIARIPYYLFSRYFILLQPILACIITLDIFILSYLFFTRHIKIFSSFFIFSIIISNLFIINGLKKITYLSEHVYELTHTYSGPLDFIIPYIKTLYGITGNLIIATNYEEYPYMYYLDSKVTIGYRGINLNEDLKIQPDIIIFRLGWYSNPQNFNHFFTKAKYKEIVFPITHYPLNNIPEFDFAFTHQFRTRLVENDRDKLRIYIRED